MRRAVLLLTLLAAGCSSGTATVSGTVTYEGKPVKTGYISFAPVDGKGTIASGPIADGKYTVAMEPGSKIVKIEAADDAGPAIRSSEDMKKLSEEMRGKVGPSGIISTDTVPADADGNNATIEVKSGGATHDFNLTKPKNRTP
jgi:hypothetical protein